MNTFSTYEQAIKAAQQLRRLKKEYESRASYLTFLTEWMNGLCVNIDEECIHQRWIQLLSAPQERETIEQEIGQRTRNQKNDRSQLLQVQEQLIRTQRQIVRIQKSQQRVGRRMNRLARKLARRSPRLGVLPDDQRCVSTTTYRGSVESTTGNVLHFRN